MKRIGLLAAAMLAAPAAQAAILYQETITATAGVANFYGFLVDPAVLQAGSTWIGITGGTITRASWIVEGEERAYRWELLYEDEEGNQDIFLDGTNTVYFNGCAVTPGAPSCTDHHAFRSQLHNNIVRADLVPPVSYDNCTPFDGNFGVVCGRRYTLFGAGYEIEVAGLADVTLTISDTRLAGAVPEPASWMMLIAGFGLTGATLRRKASSPTSG